MEINNKNMDEKDLLNWSNLSTIISGNRQNVRKNNVRPIYEKQVGFFTNAIKKAIAELRRYEIENESKMNE